MFRKMRRFKQELSHEECVEVLKNQPRGVLSVLCLALTPEHMTGKLVNES